MQIKFWQKTKKAGYTLVEMVIYVALMSVISFLIINTVLSFTKSYREVVALRIVDSGAIDSMERMTRDIRGGAIIDTRNSTLGTNPGILTLTTTTGGVSTTTKFYIQNGSLKIDVNGTYIGPLT